MQAIDDYINGNLTDAKRRAKKAGRNKIAAACQEEYGYSTARTLIIIAYLFNHVSFALTCERLNALDQQDIDDGFVQEKVGKPFTTNHALVEAARHGQALSEPVEVGQESLHAQLSRLRAETAMQTEMVDGARRAASRLMCENTELRAALEDLVGWDQDTIDSDPAGYEASQHNARAAIAKAQPQK